MFIKSHLSLQNLIVVLVNQIGFFIIKTWLTILSALSVGYSSNIFLKYQLRGVNGDCRWEYELNSLFPQQLTDDDYLPNTSNIAKLTNGRKLIKPDLRIVLECQNCGWCSYRVANSSDELSTIKEVVEY